MANVETKSDFPAKWVRPSELYSVDFFYFFKENIGNGWTDVINIAET